MGILSFSKNNFRHTAPDAPSEIEAGKITHPFEAKPLDRLSSVVSGNIPVTVSGEQIQ
jgi:hypothetical protein